MVAWLTLNFLFFGRFYNCWSFFRFIIPGLGDAGDRSFGT